MAAAGQSSQPANNYATRLANHRLGRMLGRLCTVDYQIGSRWKMHKMGAPILWGTLVSSVRMHNRSSCNKHAYKLPETADNLRLLRAVVPGYLW